MKSITIKRTTGESREYQAAAWKVPPNGGTRHQLYLLSNNNSAIVATFHHALPRFYQPGYPVVFSREPFPEAVCVEISPCRLLPPPCWRGKREFEREEPALGVFFPWKAAYLDTHKEYLTLSADADVPLQQRLDEWINRTRAANERETQQWIEQVEQLSAAPLEKLKLPSEEERAKQLKEARDQISILNSEDCIIGVPCRGWLTLTLEDAKEGCAGIRDAWMQEEWAKDHGVDLEEMARERRVFGHWLREFTGTASRIINAKPDENSLVISPPDFGRRPDDHPQFMEACANARYRARFANNAETVVFLNDFELREELDAQELEDVAMMMGEGVVSNEVGTGIQGFRAEETVAAMDPAGTPHRYRMAYLGGKRWSIAFGEYEAFIAVDSGIGHELAYVFKRPHTEFKVMDVQHELAVPCATGSVQTTGAALDEGLSPQSGTHRVERGKLTAKNYRDAHSLLDLQLESARATGDTLCVEEIENQLEKLAQYQDDARHAESDWTKACGDRFRIALKRFKKSIAEGRTAGGKAFLEHLGTHLTLARYKFHYHPPPGIRWMD